MDEAFKSYYVLDTVRFRRGEAKEEEEGEASHRASAPSTRSHPAKRLRRFPSSSSSSEPSVGELGQMVRRLEAMHDRRHEGVCSALPCTANNLTALACLWTTACLEFLLVGKNLGVLPIVGPTQIDKTTLVEHFCDDERVRSHFSMILFYSGNVLVKEESSSSPCCFRDKCAIKHQNSSDSEKGVDCN
ncbi:hypothetical protein U9M48_044687 [Paspalum notatum var. saurae]|uniref:Uncharacterized protein n=1 Tax=Paspalum notatum var. saurae TaxID=547442 RepID=A0AAQ3XGZ2_PASNO